MITRSGRAALASRFTTRHDPIGSRSKGRRSSSPADLEEEIEVPSKKNYNDVRKALIAERSRSESRLNQLEQTKEELGEKNRLLELRTSELKRCSKSNSDKIKSLEQKIKELERNQEEMRKKDGSPAPGTEGRSGTGNAEPGTEGHVGTGNEEPTQSETEILQRLKSDIHKFATKYFGGKLHKPLQYAPEVGWAARFLQATTPGEKIYIDYLHSKRRCPLIIEAFIWRFLHGTIFDNAPWSGSEEIRLPVGGLQKIFSKFYSGAGSTPEQVRKYEYWKMKTTMLISELLGAGAVTNANQHRTHLELHFAKEISEVVTPFMRISPENHVGALVNIIHQAIELDKVISNSPQRATFAFNPGPIQYPFNFSLEQENVMKLVRGERTAEKLAKGTQTKVFLVVTPGLTIRGAEDGSAESFEGAEKWFMPMEVTCTKPRRQGTFPASNGLAPNGRANGDSSDTTFGNTPPP